MEYAICVWGVILGVAYDCLLNNNKRAKERKKNANTDINHRQQTRDQNPNQKL